jgi:hypothetical protein
VSDQRQLPIGDRDEVEVPRRGELPSAFVERIAPLAPVEPTPDACGCRARGWQCRHEPSSEERLAAIFRRQPGEDG